MPNLSEVISFCTRKGFINQSSEIYGGLSGCYDYGPNGAQLKRRIENIWWNENVENQENIIGFDSSILMRNEVWQASGHVSGFHDPMVDCKSCKSRYREDQIDINQNCPDCGEKNWTDIRQFNLMLSTKIGAMEDSAKQVYLRPETAQGIFVNAINVARNSRMNAPFGIAQIGKSFRNEITPRNFLFRVREFTQMEIEFFCHPDDAPDFFEEWCSRRMSFYTESLGMDSAKLHFRDHGKEELAHYAASCRDVEYDFPFGLKELEGIANRGSFDLEQHMKHSKKNLTLSDPQKGKFVPSVIESSAGVDRTLLAVICDSLDVSDPNHIILKINPKLANIQVAILPLVKKDGMPEKAIEIKDRLHSSYRKKIEISGSIGKRYYREDEIGTPICITVDGDTNNDDSVTVRYRDTGKQDRIKIDSLNELLEKVFK
ncbi:glycine--tRNA ligase [bacterium]|nr:glycine--tRNA ligase [bacterium]|tara:strand:- start:46412 stop:47701 length:1290 start_codon:yes stop_codon:yes gene_type:complete